MVIIKVEKKKVEETFTCPLCTNLFDRATTISECLHTFCRNCIRDKLINEKLKACPICFVDLGVAPLDKLRGDYILEDMRLKLFPLQPETVKAGPETAAAFLESSKKKGKFVSSLIASSSKVSFSPDLNQDAPLEPNILVEEKLNEKVEAVPQIKGSSKPIITFKKREKKFSKPTNNDTGLESGQTHKEAVIKFHIDLNFGPDYELNKALISQECIQTKNNSDKGKIPILTDLNDTPPVIVKPAISQNGKENHDKVPRSGGDAEEVFGKKSEECVEVTHNKSVGNSSRETEKVPVEVNRNTVLISSNRKTKKVSGKKLKNIVEENQECITPRSRKIRGKKQKEESKYSPPVLRPRRRRTMSSEASTSEAAISTESENKFDRSNNPVWFSLVASGNQNTDVPLPQISAPFLRVKNGNIPVSHVKKYLVKKLGLQSEDEVEIWLRHEPVCSTQILRNVMDWWVETTPVEERKSAMIGSSGADFVMALYYSRKATS